MLKLISNKIVNIKWRFLLFKYKKYTEKDNLADKGIKNITWFNNFRRKIRN